MARVSGVPKSIGEQAATAGGTHVGESTGGAAGALVPYAAPSAVGRAVAWADLDDGERRRRAAEAAQLHDAAALWALTESWLVLQGRKGARVSPRTLANYRAAVVPPERPSGTLMGRVRLCTPLLVAWKGENLLRPGRRAGIAWIRRLEETGAKPATVQVYLAGARALYGALRDAGATEADPFRDVHVAPDPTPRWSKRRPYSDAELAALLEGAAAEERLLVLLGFHAGLRVAELVALRWAEVDPARRELTVLAGKGGKRRTVRLSPTLAAALAAAASGPRAASAYVLPLVPRRTWGVREAAYDEPARRAKRAWYLLRRRADAAGVSPLGLHALRHSAGARMRRATDLEDTARFLGHSGLGTAQIYTHWTDDRVNEVVDRW